MQWVARGGETDRVIHKVAVARVSENILGTFILVTFPLRRMCPKDLVTK